MKSIGTFDGMSFVWEPLPGDMDEIDSIPVLSESHLESRI